ncbi:MAG: ParB N-terminal domain-containing protein [Halanaerobiales bacterium]|nr:ParB N-terminal domain-containing protein [Halanaerobiales bacterium]
MNIKIVDIDELIPYENNPKEHPEEQIERIADSIDQYGFIQPIVIDKNNEIIIGHGRVKASKKLGFQELPAVIRSDLSEREIKALRIADNKIAESGWDYDALAVEFEELELEDFTGFEENEIEDILINQELDTEGSFLDDLTEDEKQEQETEQETSDRQESERKDSYLNFSIPVTEDERQFIMKALNKVKKEQDILTDREAVIYICEKEVNN